MAKDSVQKQIFILGLMHSGTTIFWRSWRQNPDLVCFDEPFSPALMTLPGQTYKRVYDEYIAILREDARRFWHVLAELGPSAELDTEFTAEQERWLRFLVMRGNRVVIDETRLHCHVSALKNLVSDPYLIHLVRRARDFVTSHLRPSRATDLSFARKLVWQLRDAYNTKRFWMRHDLLKPGLERWKVIGRDPESKFGLMLAEAGYDARAIMRAPAVVRLLAYWHYHFHLLRESGPRDFGSRYREVRYEEFTSHPQEMMRDLYVWAGLTPRQVNTSAIHVPKAAFCANDRRWREYARIAGFSAEELDALL